MPRGHVTVWLGTFYTEWDVEVFVWCNKILATNSVGGSASCHPYHAA